MPFVLRKSIGGFRADVGSRRGRLKVGRRNAQEKIRERVPRGQSIAVAVLTGELKHAVDFKIKHLVVLISRERTAEFEGMFFASPRKYVRVGKGVVRESRGALGAKADDRVGKVQLGRASGILRFYVDSQRGGCWLLHGWHGLYRVAALGGYAKFVQSVGRESVDVGEVKKPVVKGRGRAKARNGVRRSKSARPRIELSFNI